MKIDDEIFTKEEVPKRTYKKKFVRSQFVKEFWTMEEVKEFVESQPKNVVPYIIYNNYVSPKNPLTEFITVGFETVEDEISLDCQIVNKVEGLETFVNGLEGKEILFVLETQLTGRVKSDKKFLVITKETKDKIKYVGKNFFDNKSFEMFEKFTLENPKLRIVGMFSRAMRSNKISPQLYFVIFQEG